MAVREFNGSSDDIVTAIGALSGMTHGTVVALLKPDDVSASAPTQVFFSPHTSGGTGRLAWYLEEDFVGLVVFNGSPSFADTPTGFLDGGWQLLVARKATGSAVGRVSAYSYTSDTWDHANLDSALGNPTSPGAGGSVRFSHENDVFLAARVAARAAWSNSLPWSADASGDSVIEAAGLETSAMNWLANSPDAMWRFNQASTGDDVVDDTGNGADQTSITGTTVVTGDDPPGFDFSLSSGDLELDVPFFENVNSIFPITVENQSDLELNVPHLSSEAQILGSTVENQSASELNIPHHSSESQVFAPTVTTGDKQLDIPHHASESQLFTPSLDIQVALELDVPHHTSESQLFTISLDIQNDLELDLSRLESTSQIFVPQVINEGDDVFEPTLVGNGSFADQMMAGLIDQGFLTGSLADRERARLLAKLTLNEPQGFSIADLYRQADEVNRLAGVLETV